MKHEQVFATLLTVTAVCAGCATTQQCYTESTNPGFAEVCVRFVASPEPTQLANDGGYGAEARLVVDESYSGFADETCRAGMSAHDSSPYHVALWGGPFCGQDVTYNTVPLTPGPYVFGLRSGACHGIPGLDQRQLWGRRHPQCADGVAGHCQRAEAVAGI